MKVAIFLLSLAAHAGGIPVVRGAVQVVGPDQVPLGQQPVVALAVPDREAVLHVECTVTLPDGQARTFTETSATLPPGEPMQLALDVVPPTSSASCLVVANFANGLSERRAEEVSWTWIEPAPAPAEEAPPDQEPAPVEPYPATPSSRP